MTAAPPRVHSSPLTPRPPVRAHAVSILGHGFGGLFTIDLLTSQASASTATTDSQTLSFTPAFVFATGSPLGLFHAARSAAGARPGALAPTLRSMLPAGVRLCNAFHPQDAYAYRTEVPAPGCAAP